MKTIIIGGVAGGATAAARLRRKDEDMEIIMIERGEYISYANCGLPYYIGNVIQSSDALLLQTPEGFHKKFRVDVRTSSLVTRIEPKEKCIYVHNRLTNEEYRENYDKLILATGSSPIKPGIPGVDGPNVFTLWTVPDTKEIRSFISSQNHSRAVVVGGGFIGIEMAENLWKAGIHVTLIEKQAQVMPPFDPEMAGLLQENMVKNHVVLKLNQGLERLEEVNGATRVWLSNGESLDTDMVILSLGVKPNSELARNAGIELNDRGGIVVDEYLKTSVKDIYAVGDVIQVKNRISGEDTMIPLAGPANKQARILADNLTGGKRKYVGSAGTAVVKSFDLVAASVGLSEKELISKGKEKGKDYEAILIQQMSHAGYYPGATPLTLKMLFDKSGKIFGGQIIGQEGVDKRIDTLATTMELGGTIYDLTELELAYAPPFSSAKDPVNMLGFVAENVINGLVSFITADELDKRMADTSMEGDFMVLDVTEDIERMVFSIPGSYHIPLGELRHRLDELDRNMLIIPYCAIGVRSYYAARILSQNGFDRVAVLSGGTSHYKPIHYVAPSENIEEKIESEHSEEYQEKVMQLDCCGLQCPGPIMKVSEAIGEMKNAEILRVSATDMGFAADIGAWCDRTGNTLLKTERIEGKNVVTIQKGMAEAKSSQEVSIPQGKTLIIFSGDLDKVLASFIIANGAAAMGRKVTMFFTFWGLNVLRKPDKMQISKPFMENMFGRMMPRGSKKLKLSHLHMGGMGTSMMKKVMQEKNVDSLETLIQSAQKSGVRLVACTMSMDIMGIHKEELIDGLEFAGVASYLGDAEQSNVNLFI